MPPVPHAKTARQNVQPIYHMVMFRSDRSLRRSCKSARTLPSPSMTMPPIQNATHAITRKVDFGPR